MNCHLRILENVRLPSWHFRAGCLSTDRSYLLQPFTVRVVLQLGQKGQEWWVTRPHFASGALYSSTGHSEPQREGSGLCGVQPQGLKSGSGWITYLHLLLSSSLC